MKRVIITVTLFLFIFAKPNNKIEMKIDKPNNKIEKHIPENKAVEKKTVDVSAMPLEVTVIATKDSKHLTKGSKHLVGRETAGILIGQGLVELV